LLANRGPAARGAAARQWESRCTGGPVGNPAGRIDPAEPGRRVKLAEARMITDGRVAVTARTWHIATGDRPPATGEEQAAPPPVPPRPASQPFYPGLDDWGSGRSIEWRFTRGGFDSLGAADVWARVRLPLVGGVPLTGQDRRLIAADSANGLSLSLPLEQWFSIPSAMTATLLRPPAGEWVHLVCRTYLSDVGVGLAHADLFDPDGLIGEAAQLLLVQKRRPGQQRLLTGQTRSPGGQGRGHARWCGSRTSRPPRRRQ
jgi:hypothetical protein